MDWVPLAVARAAAETLPGLPDDRVRGVGEALGRLWKGLFPDQRRTALENLAAAQPPVELPEPPDRWLDRVYRHLGTMIVETLVLLDRLPRRNVREFVDVTGIGPLEEARRAGRGALIVSGHLGNWELGALTLAALGHPLASVARPFRNAPLEAFVRELRQSTGQTVLPMDGSARELLRWLKDGGVVAVLLDQNAGRRGTFVNYFGRPASTLAAPIALALRAGADVLPTFCTRVGDGLRYRLECAPAIRPPGTGDGERDAGLVLQAFVRELERRVRQIPEQWLWIHRRWKSKPRPGAVVVSE